MQIRLVVFESFATAALVLLTFGSAALGSDWAAIAKRCAEESPGNQARQLSCITAARDDARFKPDEADHAEPQTLRDSGKSCRGTGGTDCGRMSPETTNH